VPQGGQRTAGRRKVGGSRYVRSYASIQGHHTKYPNPDNTNADVKAREYWTELAKSLEIPIRCVHFTAPSKLCEHNDAFRSIGGQKLEVRTHELRDAVKTMQHLLTLRIGDQMNPESRVMLPRHAFTGFAARYSAPTLDEGFVDITKVDFEVRCRSISSRVRDSGTKAAATYMALYV
jgi:hypothetical protein